MLSYFSGDNKIKFINSQVITGFPTLRELRLKNNDCINKDFLFMPVLNVSVEVSNQCGFMEVAVDDGNKIGCSSDWKQKAEKRCLVESSSLINAANFTFSNSRDDKIIEIRFDLNKKVELLPILVHFKFSNLVSYVADNCAIGDIIKLNFEHLTRLRNLNLTHNRIEKIRRDIFDGLLELRTIWLSKKPNFCLNDY